MDVVVVTERVEADRAVAREIADLVAERRREGRSCALGLAAGMTPVGVYRELVRLHREEGASFSNALVFALDEYIGLEEGDVDSFHEWLRETLTDHLDVPRRAVQGPRAWVPAAVLDEECLRYEEQLAKAGGLDLALLGVGANGHVAFNEPGTAAGARTHVARLAYETRAANARWFKDRRVPSFALTMGLGTIRNARILRMLAFGRKKAEAVLRLREALPGAAPDPAWPCTALLGHSDFRLFVDEAAAGSPRDP